MHLRLIIFLYAFFTPLYSTKHYINRRSKRQGLGTGSVSVNSAIGSNPVQQMPPVNPPAVVNPAPNPVAHSVPVNAAVVPNPDQPVPLANLGGVVSPVPQAAVPVNPAAVVPVNSAQPIPPLSPSGIVSPVQQASPGQAASGSVQINPVTVPIPAQAIPPANPVGVVNPAPRPVEPNVVPVNPALSPVGANSVPVNPAVIPVPPQPQSIATVNPTVNSAQQIPPNLVVPSSVPVNPAVVPVQTQQISPVNPIGVTSPSTAQQQPSSSLSVDSVSIKPDIETSSSSSETSDSASGDDSSYYEEEDLSCYSKCIGLTSDTPITIDSNLKYDAEVKQTDLSSTCPLYQSAKTCMNDCPASSSVSNFNEIYKLTTFLCVDKLTDASRYFSCTLNDKRDYQDECDSDNTTKGSTVQPDGDQDTESDVTIYCKNQRCMMKKKLESLQQSCPDILPFARNYFKLDVDIIESTQEYGALWTIECSNLQKSLETNVPL